MLDTFRSLLRTGRDISICKKQEKYIAFSGFGIAFLSQFEFCY